MDTCRAEVASVIDTLNTKFIARRICNTTVKKKFQRSKVTPRTVNFFNLKKGTEQIKNFPLPSCNKHPEISNIRIQKCMMIYETIPIPG